MTMKTSDCVDCGESVPKGRLSCPACGALLASVTGALRSPAPSPGDEPVQAEAVTSAQQVVAVTRAEPAEPVVVALSTATPWSPLADPEPILAPRPYRRHVLREPDAPAVLPPSAYRPPLFSLSTASSVGPSWPSATPAYAGFGGMAGKADASTDIASDPGVVDAERFVEIARWFVIVGAAMSVLGFLLPWSRVVIGAAGFGGYFDRWGLAAPTHLVVFGGLLAVLGSGIVRTSVPAWVGSGVSGLAAGSLLIGLTWPYLAGPLGADVGVMVTALGGLALVIGGVVASWATRHAETDPPV